MKSYIKNQKMTDAIDFLAIIHFLDPWNYRWQTISFEGPDLRQRLADVLATNAMTVGIGAAILSDIIVPDRAVNRLRRHALFQRRRSWQRPIDHLTYPRRCGGVSVMIVIGLGAASRGARRSFGIFLNPSLKA
jgi:hypothetical protein